MHGIFSEYRNLIKKKESTRVWYCRTEFQAFFCEFLNLSSIPLSHFLLSLNIERKKKYLQFTELTPVTLSTVTVDCVSKSIECECMFGEFSDISVVVWLRRIFSGVFGLS